MTNPFEHLIFNGMKALPAGQSMPSTLEQVIIQYYRHIYTTKAAALRAARNKAQRTMTSFSWGMVCTDAEILRGFHGYIRFTIDMIVVEAYENGWRWGVSCKRGDVLVWVRLPNLRCVQIPYREAVGRWHNTETPIANRRD